MALSQSFHLDYQGDDPILQKLFRDADEMFNDLFNALATITKTPTSSSINLVTSGMGAPGQDGQDGDDGLPGPTGATGAQGIQGPLGPMGAIILADDGQDGDIFPPIVGPQGNPGPTGSQGPMGPTQVFEDPYVEDVIVPVYPSRLPDNIVQTLESTVYTITAAFADITNLTVNISPRFQSSKVRVTGCVNIYLGSGLSAVSCRLMRNGSSIQQYDTVAFNNNLQVTGATAFTFDFIDSPASISAVTYKVQARNTQGGSVINNIINGGDLVISSITAEEILQ